MVGFAVWVIDEVNEIDELTLGLGVVETEGDELKDVVGLGVWEGVGDGVEAVATVNEADVPV